MRRTTIRKILPLSTFVVVGIIHFIGQYLGACTLCRADGSWVFCGNSYMLLFTVLFHLPIAVVISVIWWLKLWLLDRKSKKHSNLQKPPS